MLLATKLFRPKPDPDQLVRPRLHRKLDDGAQRDLTLVASPAGYGKSTVIASWLEANAQRPSCWLSLDTRDNNPILFWRYVIAALQTIEPNFGRTEAQALSLAPPPPLDQIVHGLINALWANHQAHGEQWVLVLDDYHRITNSAVHNALDQLIEHVPAEVLRIVISSRADPPLKIARRRVLRQLCELRQQDLAFTADEAAELVSDWLRAPVGSEALDRLMTQTEGWIASIQLIALSLQGHGDPMAALASWQAGNRYVAAYLAEDVLAHQPPHIRAFLHKTAHLEGFSAEMLTHLFPNEDTASILQYLAKQHLFLIPLDVHQTEFRYHHLFADLLKTTAPNNAQQRIEMLRSASRWHAQHQQWPLAIDYAFRADDKMLAANHIVALAFPEPNPTRWRYDWLEALDDTHYERHPQLHLIHALLLFNQPVKSIADRARKQMELAEARLTNRQDNTPFWHAMLLIFRTNLMYLRGDVRSAVDVAAYEQGIKQLGVRAPYLCAVLHLILGQTHLQHERHEPALREYAEAQRKAKLGNNIFIELTAQTALWRIKMATQNAIPPMRQDIEAFIAASPMVQSAHPLSGLIWSQYGHVLGALGESEAAITALQKAMSLLTLTTEHNEEGRTARTLAILLANCGQRQASLDLLNKSQSRLPLYQDRVRLAYLQIQFWQYDSNKHAHIELDSWYEGRPIPTAEDVDPFHYDFLNQIYTLTLIGRVAMARGDDAVVEQVCEMQSRFANQIAQFRINTLILRLWVNHAIFLQSLGQESAAVALMRQATDHAGAIEDRFAFIEARHLGLSLLYQLQQAEPSRWVQSLIDCVNAEQQMRFDSGDDAEDDERFAAAIATLVDPLTTRELEILQLIAAGMTNKQIAATLFVSPNTVRVHTSNIYSKLSVATRMQAATKARSLGILPA